MYAWEVRQCVFAYACVQVWMYAFICIFKRVCLHVCVFVLSGTVLDKDKLVRLLSVDLYCFKGHMEFFLSFVFALVSEVNGELTFRVLVHALEYLV